MKLKKTMGLLLALTLSASVFASLGTVSAFADGTATPPADSSIVEFNTDNAELHLPETYEQYLPLEKPTSFALSKKSEKDEKSKIAVADGANLYYYDPNDEEPRYKHYEHNANISKVQFSERGDLFFSSGLSFYRADTSGEEIEEHILDNLPCTSFLFADSKLFVVRQETDSYTATVSYLSEDELYKENFNGYNNDQIKLIDSYDTNKSIYIAYHSGDRLLYVAEQLNVHIYNLTEDPITVRHAIIDSTGTLNLNSVEIHDGKFYYTKSGTGEQGGLYTSDCKEGNTDRLDKPDECAMEFTALTSCNGEFYCIYGGTIRKLSFTDDGVAFSGYEIANKSDSPYRLSNPYKIPDTDKTIDPETVRTKEIVAITDTDNKRVSLYNRLEKSYTVISCLDDDGEPFVPEHIAIDKEEVTVKANDDVVTSNKIAVSVANKIYVYTFERHSLFPEENGVTKSAVHETIQEITGLSFVYGECYFITANNGFGSLSADSKTGYYFSAKNSSPTAIASDVYGTLYVAFGNDVYSYTEANFKEGKDEGKEIISLSNDSAPVYTSLTVDYEGNIWHLGEDGTLYCNNVEKATIDGKDFVYVKGSDYPVSFALSFEDDEVYFNFKNYVVKTKPYELTSLSSLNKIPTGEANVKAFDLANCNNLFVKVPAGSVGFQINLSDLKNDKAVLPTGEIVFPYESYFRLKDETAGGAEIIYRQGVLLYEPQDENDYYVIALYDVKAHSFTANLFKKSRHENIEPLTGKYEPLEPAEDADENEAQYYISSSLSLCSAPSLFIAPDGERLSPLSDYLLERGSIVTVLGFAEGEDRDYAYVEVLTRERIIRQGYVPRSYLTKNNPLGITEQNYKLGYLRGDAGIILKGQNGEELEIKDKTEAKLYKNEDGTYTAVVEKDGVVYSNTVLSDQISRGETDALRISLIVVLSALALVIIGGYAFLMFPKKKKK